MNHTAPLMPHSADQEWYATYAAATLSSPKAVVLACQAEMHPQIARQLSQLDEVGGALLETAPGEPVSADFMDRMMQGLDSPAQALADIVQPVAVGEADVWMPRVLRRYIEQAGVKLVWRQIGRGLKCAWLTHGPGQERLYLLRARPGLKLPVHTHTGEEWTLVLHGGYHVGNVGYERGDLHSEDASCQHQPVIDDDGEECISLIADDGCIRLRNPLLTLVQPIFRL